MSQQINSCQICRRAASQEVRLIDLNKPHNHILKEQTGLDKICSQCAINKEAEFKNHGQPSGYRETHL